jgi:hypothetical protein
MEAETRRHGARFLVLLIAPGELVQIARNTPVPPERWRYLARCYRAAEEICRSLNLTYIDSLPHYVAHAQRGEPLYIPSDAHWTPQGHALAAQLIRRKLSEEHFLPPECFPPGTGPDSAGD